MELDPIHHAETVTGRSQSGLSNLWSRTGFAAALSDVNGPHVYDYGDLPIATIAITLYDVRRHVLIEDGRVRRDGRVPAGRFRVGQPGRNVVVDAIPDVPSGKLLILYLGDLLMKEVGAGRGDGSPLQLMDRAWDVDDPLLALSAKRIIEASQSSLSGHSLLAEQMAYSLALHLSDRYAVPSFFPSSDVLEISAGKYQRIAEFVRADISRDITLSDMANIAGLTPNSFIRSFKRATGLTPHRFLVGQRVDVAKHLLSSSEMAIAEIALTVGFSSQSHLGSTFTALVGMSPARFRRLTRS